MLYNIRYTLYTIRYTLYALRYTLYALRYTPYVYTGILSYPRTETDFFQEGTELLPLLEEHRRHPTWGAYAAALLDNGGFQWPSNGGHDDQVSMELARN